MPFLRTYKEIIRQVAPELTLSGTSMTVTGAVKTASFTYTYEGDGEITVVSSDESVATCTVDATTCTVTVNYISAGSCTVTVNSSETDNYYAQSAVMAVACAKSTSTLTPSVTALTVQGGTGSNTFTYSYNGDGAISVASSNTAIATVSVSGTTVTVKYVAAGSCTVTVSSADGVYYSANSAACNITCARTKVTIPSLSGTSFSTTGSSVGPTVSNYNSTYMTQSGTTKTATIGSYTVTWALKDSSKYCWSDGATANKSVTWKCVAGTITFYVRDFVSWNVSGKGDVYQQSTYIVSYGATWINICTAKTYPSNRTILATYGYGNGSTGWEGYFYVNNSKCALYSRNGSYYFLTSTTATDRLYANCTGVPTNGVYRSILTGLSNPVTDGNSLPQNGQTYYCYTHIS